MATTYSVKITFMDGHTVSFRGTPQVDTEEWQKGAKVQELIESQCIAIESEGRLLFYPTANIRSIEVSPAPKALPRVVLRNVELVE